MFPDSKKMAKQKKSPYVESNNRQNQVIIKKGTNREKKSTERVKREKNASKRKKMEMKRNT